MSDFKEEINKIEGILIATAFSHMMKEKNLELSHACSELEPFMEPKEYNELMNHCLDLICSTDKLKKLIQEILDHESAEIFKKVMEDEDRDSNS